MGLTLDLSDDIEEAGLWEEHLPAWTAWCAVSTQWRTLTLSRMEGAKVVWLGLDYTGAATGLSLSGIDVTPKLWAEVREIEAGAVKELNRGR